MLPIAIAAGEMWDSAKEEFVYSTKRSILLEHSLISISKWESKWNKPFLSKEPMTPIEFLDYIKCMTLTQNVDPMVYEFLSDDNIDDILNYIDAPMTATIVRDDPSSDVGKEIVTSELIYYWMVTFNIPFECQKWHINRLITLIKVCETKNKPAKKRSRKDVASQYAALNEARKQQLKTKG